MFYSTEHFHIAFAELKGICLDLVVINLKFHVMHNIFYDEYLTVQKAEDF